MHGQVRNDQGKITRAKILLDSGNLTRAGIAISEAFRQKMQLKLASLGGRKVSTAGTGLGMTRMGVSQPFQMRIPGIQGIFRVPKAIVIKELTDEVNLGTGFLQRLQAVTGRSPSLKFHANGTSLCVGEDSIELVKKVGTGPSLEPERARRRPPGSKKEPEPVRQGRGDARTNPLHRHRPKSIGTRARGLPLYCIQDTHLRANSLTFVPVRRMNEPRGEQWCSNGALVEGVDLGHGAQVTAITAVYDIGQRIAVLNEGRVSQVIKKGTQVGEISPLRQAPQGLPGGSVKRISDEEKELEELYKQLNLKDNALLKAHPKMLSQVKELIREYQDVFASPEHSIGKTDLMEFDISLTPGAKPVKSKVRPLNPKYKESLRKQLDLWEREDVIEPCESPWASAMVPALKKGGEIRWAIDYRGLNASTVADAYPLPNIGENLDSLQGSQVYSTLDASAAYHTIPVAETARPLLAFVTPFGSYSFKRMPFGAKNAGATYSRFIDLLIGKLRSPYLLAYVDDVIIHTPNLHLHVQELEKALKLHREAGIKLNAQKTHLFKASAEYLGFKVDANGIHMQDEYVQRILDWPVPQTVKQLASFLGFTGYYRSFISQYAHLTTEMNAQKKQKTLNWTPEMGEKFQILKGLFANKPIRAYPRFGENEAMFLVSPDWSSEAMGVVLEQEQDGQIRFIAAAGRKTTAGEKNYPPTKGELSAIVFALRKFEHILRYKRFMIYCDHQPLQWLQRMKNPRGIYWRWLTELATYEFEIRYKPGKKIGAADGLSRSPHMRDPTPEEVKEAEEFVGHLETGSESSLDRVNLRRAQEEDEVLQTVRKWVKGAPPKSREELRGLPEDAHAYHKLLKLIHEDEGGVLVRRDIEEVDHRDRVLIPPDTKVQNEVFYWSHEHPTAGHFGCNATQLRACQKFYWPGMHDFLKRKVRTCNDCLAKIQKTNLHDTTHQPRRHGYPGEVLYVDLVGPMPENDRGNKYIVTMMDGFTKYVSAVAIPCKEAGVVANALIEGWITKFGCPTCIHTDQGKEFVNNIWSQLCDRLQIRKTTTPAYSPQGNLVERFHRSLNQIMRVYMNRDDKSWERFVSTACLAYNTKVNATTGVTPHEAWTGRPARLPIDLVIPLPKRNYDHEDSYITDTMRRFEVMYAAMRKRAEDTFRRNAKLYSGSTEDYAIGDLVWVFSKRKVEGKPMKVTDAWMGPYKVVGKTSDVTLQVKPAETSGRVQTVHVTTVRRFYPTGCTGLKHRPPREPVATDDGDELAEELGRPPRMIEPPDQVTTAVPIQHESSRGSLEMRDLPRIEPTTPAARSSRQPAEGSTTGAGPAPTAADQGVKRTPSPGSPGPARKQPHRRGEKRDRDSDGERRHPRRSWRRLAEPEGARQPDMETSSDEEVRHINDEVATSSRVTITALIPDGIQLPHEGRDGSWECPANQSLTLYPGRATWINTGMRLALPPGYSFLVFSQPRLAEHSVTVTTSVVTPDARGMIRALLQNNSLVPRRIQKGERICRGVAIHTPRLDWQRVATLPERPYDDVAVPDDADGQLPPSGE